MELLKQRILKDGEVLPSDVLRVDGFLNHQIDVAFISECAKAWYEKFKDSGVTKILTIESAGIGIACIAAQYFGVPVVYAKKTRGAYIGDDVYSTKVVSYTHGQVYEVRVSKKYINPGDRILLIDDFLANGSALKVLINLAERGGATVVGAGIAIEKAYQKGGRDIRALGYRIESLARIESMSIDGGVVFAED